MVICFTKHLLDQKHNLSKIWLAAHWEKKIKRPQIFEIDIEKTIQDMIEAEVNSLFTFLELFKNMKNVCVLVTFKRKRKLSLKHTLVSCPSQIAIQIFFLKVFRQK